MQTTSVGNTLGERFSVDTTFVLFFLAVDLGQSLLVPGLDTLVSAVTFGVVLILPYYLPTDLEKPDFTEWLIGRSLIGVFAILLGMMFRTSLGVVLPEAFAFLPMTLLIVTAALSCYLQFYAMIRFRLAR